MIAVIMAGGKGSRMGEDEKLLLPFHDKPLIMHVVDALSNSGRFSKIIAVTSPNAPDTKTLLEKTDNVEVLDSSGNGYVADLEFVLSKIKDKYQDAVLVTSGDLPMLDDSVIRKIVDNYDSKVPWLTILVTAKFQNSLKQSAGYSVDFRGTQCRYTGISIVNSSLVGTSSKIQEDYVVLDDKRIAFNVNTKEDYEKLLLSTA